MISDDYRKTQQKLHEDPSYGTASIAAAPIVTQICNTYQVRELLDYGAGKMRLFDHIKPDHPMRLQAYDPAVEALSEMPVPSQMVTCIDVLEHIEPEYLDQVLDHLRDLTLEYGFFTVHTEAAMKFLADGRNAHLIQQPPEWWLPRLMARFDLQVFQRTDKGFFVVVMKREEPNGNHELL